MRTSEGDQLGAAGRAGQFEKRVGVCPVGAGGAPGARALWSASRRRRRELRRRWRGRVASGATSAARGRRRKPCLLAPQPEEASAELATARGCARRSGRLALPRCCPLLRPAPAPAPDPAVSRSGRVGVAVPASCPPLCCLFPLAFLPSLPPCPGLAARSLFGGGGGGGLLNGEGGGAGPCCGRVEVSWRGYPPPPPPTPLLVSDSPAVV